MIRDARNLVFDADCALLDGDVKKARDLLRQADLILREMQKDDGAVQALRGEDPETADALGRRGRVHRLHEGTVR